MYYIRYRAICKKIASGHITGSKVPLILLPILSGTKAYVKDKTNRTRNTKLRQGNEMFKFELYMIVRDQISGFTGVILSRAEEATGCRVYGLQPQKLTKEGTPADWEWFDESRLVTTGKKIKSLTVIGGPSPLPPSE